MKLLVPIFVLFFFNLLSGQVFNPETGEEIEEEEILLFDPETGMPIKQPGEIEKSLKLESEDPLITLQREIDSIRKKRNILVGLTVAGIVLSGITLASAESAYSEYKTATTNATALHRTVETNDRIYPLAFGTGIGCLFLSVNYQQQLRALRNDLKIILEESYK